MHSTILHVGIHAAEPQLLEGPLSNKEANSSQRGKWDTTGQHFAMGHSASQLKVDLRANVCSNNGTTLTE